MHADDIRHGQAHSFHHDEHGHRINVYARPHSQYNGSNDRYDHGTILTHVNHEGNSYEHFVPHGSVFHQDNLPHYIDQHTGHYTDVHHHADVQRHGDGQETHHLSETHIPRSADGELMHDHTHTRRTHEHNSDGHWQENTLPLQPSIAESASLDSMASNTGFLASRRKFPVVVSTKPHEQSSRIYGAVLSGQGESSIHNDTYQDSMRSGSQHNLDRNEPREVQTPGSTRSRISNPHESSSNYQDAPPPPIHSDLSTTHHLHPNQQSRTLIGRTAQGMMWNDEHGNGYDRAGEADAGHTSRGSWLRKLNLLKLKKNQEPEKHKPFLERVFDPGYKNPYEFERLKNGMLIAAAAGGALATGAGALAREVETGASETVKAGATVAGAGIQAGADVGTTAIAGGKQIWEQLTPGSLSSKLIQNQRDSFNRANTAGVM